MSQGRLSFCPPEGVLTFEEFLCGTENILAVQKAILMAENGRSSLQTPGLYIHGAPGTGKTHLLCAIANGANSLTTLVVSVSDLLDQLNDTWKRGHSINLRDYFIEPDIVLFDDLHVLRDDQRFQDDILSVIRLRLDANLAVAVTASAPPIFFQTSALSSNLFSDQWDLAQLAPCDRESLLSIFKKFLGDFEISELILQTIVDNEKKNSKRLKEWAVGLRARRDLTNLLRALGFELVSVSRKDVKAGGPAITSQWRIEIDGRRTLVDVSHLLAAGKGLYRCWCPYSST